MASVYVSFGPQVVLTIFLWHGLSSYDIGTMSMSAPVRPWSHRPLSPLPMPPSPKCPLSPTPPPPARFPLASVLMGGKKKDRGPQSHWSRVVCLILGSSIFLSMCVVILRRSFCRSLACLYFSLNLRAASGVKTHCSPSQYACDLGLPTGRMGTRPPAP